MKIRVLAVEKESIWSPDLLQKLPVHGKFIDQIRLVELQSLVIPILPAQICIIKTVVDSKIISKINNIINLNASDGST